MTGIFEVSPELSASSAALPSRNLLQRYAAVGFAAERQCDCQDPRQIQQNSYRHDVHVMWLQPKPRNKKIQQ